MTGFWNPLAALLGKVWAAFFGALVGGLPERAREWLLLVENPVRVQVSGLADFERLENQTARSVLDIVIGGKLVLAHRFLLPLVAKGDVRNAVTLEVERIMPLDSRLFHVAYSFGDRKGGDDIEVLILVVRRHVAEKILALAGQAETVVRRVYLGSGDSDPIALSFRAIQMRNAFRISVVALLIGAVIFSLSLIPQVYRLRLEQAIAATDEAIQVSRQKTAAIAGLQRQVRAMESLASEVEDKRRRAHILDLLVQLTQASPDTIMIEEMRLDGNRLALRGIGREPEDWVVKLQENKAFRDVTLLSVVGQGPDVGRQFDVRMDVVWPFERAANAD